MFSCFVTNGSDLSDPKENSRKGSEDEIEDSGVRKSKQRTCMCLISVIFHIKYKYL